MKSYRMMIPLAVLICAWGCEPTPYQKAGPTSAGGYSEKRLSEDTFHVQFTGSPAMSADVMQDVPLPPGRRADASAPVPAISPSFGSRVLWPSTRPFTATASDQAAGIEAEEVEVPARGTLHMTIQCFKNPENASDTSLIDAEAYLYGRPESKLSHG